MVELLRQEAELTALLSVGPTDDDHAIIRILAKERDAALSKTAGSLLRALYAASRDVLADGSWPEKHICPVSEVAGDKPLLPEIETKLNAFEPVADTIAKIEAEWVAKDWDALKAVESAHPIDKDDLPFFRLASQRLAEKSLTEAQVEKLWTWRAALTGRVSVALSMATANRLAIEKRPATSLQQPALWSSVSLRSTVTRPKFLWRKSRRLPIQQIFHRYDLNPRKLSERRFKEACGGSFDFHGICRLSQRDQDA